MKKLSGADQQLIEAIRKDPGHVLSHYARPLCISPQLALFTVERLIARGEVKRHSCTEKLSIPAPAEPVPKPAAPLIDTSEPVVSAEVPSFVSGWFRDQVKDVPKQVTTADLRAAILEQLRTGEKTTNELADALLRKGPSIGGALHTLRKEGLIVSDGPLGNRTWRLLEIGAQKRLDKDEPRAESNTPTPNNKSASLRQALRDHGSCTCQQLADLTGIPTSKIGALLSWDIRNGRIAALKVTGQRIRYSLLESAEPQQMQPAVISDDETLLRDRVAELEGALRQMTASRDYFESSFQALRRDFDAFESVIRPVYAAAQQIDAIWKPLSDSGVLRGSEAAG